jgi:Asp-tRNA(Asn)/Glu-tRNA(Gln) amidotransferase A subunit family amidase
MAVSLLGDRLGDICGLLQKSFAQAQALSATDYALALGRVARFRYNMRRFFEGYDLLLTPVTAEPAFRIDDPIWDIEHRIPLEGILKFMFTPPFDMSGNPAASVPVGFTPDGLPIGLHVVGRWGEEATVLRAARYLERERPWAQHRPPEPN